MVDGQIVGTIDNRWDFFLIVNKSRAFLKEQDKLNHFFFLAKRKNTRQILKITNSLNPKSCLLKLRYCEKEEFSKKNSKKSLLSINILTFNSK